MCVILLQNEGEDDLKKRQLMELAILNGTYRDTKAAGAIGSGALGTAPRKCDDNDVVPSRFGLCSFHPLAVSCSLRSIPTRMT